jgi:CIC family chloride channel protein
VNHPHRSDTPPAPAEETPGGVIGFAAAAVLVGALTGLVTGSFTLVLKVAASVRNSLVRWGNGHSVPGLLLTMAACSAAAVVAAAVVRRIEPHAEGSGIPRTEAVVDGRIAPGSPLILPVKFLSGTLAIGAGLALGREGPSVQMGGNIGIIVSRLTRRNRADLRLLVAAGAAAGLTTAFNAPIAGGVFILEELVKKFEPRTAVATLLASGSGFLAATLITGSSGPDFTTVPMGSPSVRHLPIILLVGLLAGLLGVAYNKMVLGGLKVVDGSRLPPEFWGGAIGALVGAIAFVAPDLVGGGDPLTQRALLSEGSIAVVAGILVARMALGVVSYSAATSGGLFAPMLVVGSHLGLLVGLVAQLVVPQWTPQPAELALIGMAALFTATVRAPITGIVLATELTGASGQLPPMLGACAVAMVVAGWLHSRPIYDALADRSAAAAQQNAAESKARRSESRGSYEGDVTPSGR